MPNPAASHLYDRAILWPNEGADGYGQPLLGAPVEVRCRWNGTKRDVLDSQGARVSVDATVILLQDVTVGSEMVFGPLDDWLGTGLTQGDETEVMVVKTFSSVYDIRGRYATRTAGLMKKAATRNKDA